MLQGGMGHRIAFPILGASLALGCAPAVQPTSATDPSGTPPPPAEPPTGARDPVESGAPLVLLVDVDGTRREVRPDEPHDALILVDAAMRRDGNLGVYGDLTGGLAWAADVFRVTVTDQGDRLLVDLGPRSDAGHDFTFEVVRATGELLEPVIGEVAPPPE